MTRKQALLEALVILDKQNQRAEIIEIKDKLKELIEDLPITNWTEKTIFDTFEQFAIENGRNATVTDMKKRGLPPHTVIKHRLGIESKVFLDRYFPPKCSSRRYNQKYREEWLEIFKNEYTRIKPSSAEEYNELRSDDLPSWGAIAHLFEIDRWSEFQKFCELPVYVKKRGIKQKTSSQIFNILSHSDIGNLYIELCQQIESLKKM